MAKRSQRHTRYQDQEDAQVLSLQQERAKRSRRKQMQNADHRPTLEYRSEAQYHFSLGIDQHVLSFGLGPAGVGKSHIPAAKAALKLLNGDIEKIIITRPMIKDDEEDIGMLPGTIEDKTAPWFAPIKDILEKYLGKGAVECHVKNGNIVFIPLQFMRGITLSDCAVIMDEAQNATKKQMEKFLTRIGTNCSVVVNGDEDQCDLPGANGLSDAVKRLKGVDDVFFFRFTANDIVRSALCRQIVARYHPVKHKLEPEEASEED